MTAIRSFTLPLLLLPLILFAQTDGPEHSTDPITPPQYHGPHFSSTADSLDFARFHDRIERVVDTSNAIVFLEDHRLVWHERRHGSSWTVKRGDGRSLTEFLTHPPVAFFPYRGEPTPCGKRCMIVVLDLPTGLIQRDTWYFEAP